MLVAAIWGSLFYHEDTDTGRFHFTNPPYSLLALGLLIDRLFYTSVSLLLSSIQGYHYHLSKFHIYALVY